MTRSSATTGPDREAELLGNLPLQYFDGPDFCVVRDATGCDFALTVQPELMQILERLAGLSPRELADERDRLRGALKGAHKWLVTSDDPRCQPDLVAVESALAQREPQHGSKSEGK